MYNDFNYLNQVGQFIKSKKREETTTRKQVGEEGKRMYRKK